MTATSGISESLGYGFKTKSLLTSALTHSSAGENNNERLEFLGDAVLDLVIAEALFERFPYAQEGKLSRLRSTLVNREALAMVARDLDLAPHLTLGQGEKKSGGMQRESILANALEAIIGAIYLDGGLEVCRERVLAWFSSMLDRILPEAIRKDPKTELQEMLQARRLPVPAYGVTVVTGKPHKQLFTVTCQCAVLTSPVSAQGPSRRRAEQAAAMQVLALLREASDS
ncbi:MAG: ribonuclease III [Gammaproteobacteria bacterium]